jgi:hypothetical protein
MFLWQNFFLERPRTILITFLDIEICRNFLNFCRENFDLFWKFLLNLFCGSLFDHEMAFWIAIIGIDKPCPSIDCFLEFFGTSTEFWLVWGTEFGLVWGTIFWLASPLGFARVWFRGCEAVLSSKMETQSLASASVTETAVTTVPGGVPAQTLEDSLSLIAYHIIISLFRG